MNIHSRSYQTQTTPAIPGYVRPPTTMYEHFRADPHGAASYPEWIYGLPGKWAEHGPGVTFFIDYGSPSGPRTFAACVELATARHAEHPELHIHVYLLDGTVVKEWLPETKDSATVEKT